MDAPSAAAPQSIDLYLGVVRTKHQEPLHRMWLGRVGSLDEATRALTAPSAYVRPKAGNLLLGYDHAQPERLLVAAVARGGRRSPEPLTQMTFEVCGGLNRLRQRMVKRDDVAAARWWSDCQHADRLLQIALHLGIDRRLVMGIALRELQLAFGDDELSAEGRRFMDVALRWLQGQATEADVDRADLACLPQVQDLFAPTDAAADRRTARVMAIRDAVHIRYGVRTLDYLRKSAKFDYDLCDALRRALPLQEILVRLFMLQGCADLWSVAE